MFALHGLFWSYSFRTRHCPTVHVFYTSCRLGAGAALNLMKMSCPFKSWGSSVGRVKKVRSSIPGLHTNSVTTELAVRCNVSKQLQRRIWIFNSAIIFLLCLQLCCLVEISPWCYMSVGKNKLQNEEVEVVRLKSMWKCNSSVTISATFTTTESSCESTHEFRLVE